MTFLDKTFCISPRCENKCGRKMTDKERKLLDSIPEDERYISASYFCDKEGNLIRREE